MSSTRSERVRWSDTGPSGASWPSARADCSVAICVDLLVVGLVGSPPVPDFAPPRGLRLGAPSLLLPKIADKRAYPGPVSGADDTERLWSHRVRWRMRGALEWPLFAVLTVVDALVLHAWPIAGDGIGIVPALLLAAFFNLVAVAAGGPLAGWLLR